MTTDLSPPMSAKPHLTTSKIDVGKALKLRLQGNTFEEIGQIFGVTRSAIHQALLKFEPFLKNIEPGTLTAYSENRAELFATVEQHLTGSLLDSDALAKASLNNRAYALKVIHEARRLESGQSTNNISVLGKFIQQAETQLGSPKLVSTGQSMSALPAQEGQIRPKRKKIK